MIDSIKKMLGLGPKADIGQLIRNGAVIVDVRTRGEYSGGHVKGSVNIPLDQIESHIDKLKKKNKPVVTCCASGMRSGSARRILESAGIEAYNGGSWQSVNAKV